MNDGEIDMMISFNPSEAAVSINAGLLPDTVRTFVFAKGTIGNTSFVAIPYNAANKEGAMVVADFLLEPATQARAQDYRADGQLHGARPREADARRTRALRRAAASPRRCRPTRSSAPPARAASVVDDADRERMGEAVHEVTATAPGRLLRAMPALTVGVFLLPIAAGLAGTLLPAFGYLPAIGGNAFNLDGFAAPGRLPGLRDQRGASRSRTGVATALLAVTIACGFCAYAHDRPWMRRLSAMARADPVDAAFGDRDRARVPDRAVRLDRARGVAVADRVDAAARRRDGRRCRPASR